VCCRIPSDKNNRNAQGRWILKKVGDYAAEITDLKEFMDQSLVNCFRELNRLKRYIGST
jgi:hypothetical protein